MPCSSPLDSVPDHVQEFVVPALNLKANEIYYTRVKRKGGFNPDVENNVVIKISPQQMLFAKEVNPPGVCCTTRHTPFFFLAFHADIYYSKRVCRTGGNA